MSGKGGTPGVSVRYRNGCNDDAPDLARLLELATQGAASRIWKTMMLGNEKNPLEAGARIICGPGHSWAPERAVIADAGGVIAGAAYAYPLHTPETEPDYNALPIDDAPYYRLQHRAGNAIYIDNISVFPEFRGMGVGHKLMERVIDRARGNPGGADGDIDRIALIVNDDNIPARRFYESRGFSYTAAEEVPAGAYYPEGKRVHLMTRPLGGQGVAHFKRKKNGKGP